MLTVEECREIRVFDDPKSAFARLRDERSAFVSGFSDGESGWPPRPGDRPQSLVHGDAYALGYAAGREEVGLEPWAPELQRAWDDGLKAGESEVIAAGFAGRALRWPAVAPGPLGVAYRHGFWAGATADRGE